MVNKWNEISGNKEAQNPCEFISSISNYHVAIIVCEYFFLDILLLIFADF